MLRGDPTRSYGSARIPTCRPKVLMEDEKRPLGEMISGELPYLMKILSAARPLSIQTHPSESRAREGFAKENAAGIPIDARHRNYRDPHHKPELLCALTDFYALRGFVPTRHHSAASP